MTNTKPDITSYSDFNLLRDNSYTINEMKQFGTKFVFKFKQKKKKEMKDELYVFLRNNYYALKIQHVWHTYFIKLFNKSQGPARFKRALCNNVEDFLTTETVQEIDYYFFFSYKDSDGFIYGFNLISIYNLIIKKDTKNPYTRNSFSIELIETIHKRINYNKILNKTYHELTNEPPVNSDTKLFALFQKMDLLGNYTQAEWLIDLTPYYLRRFILELYDIWEYRAQLTIETKLAICGAPFRDIPMHLIQTQHNMNKEVLKQFCATIINNFINSSQIRENQYLGSIYVLSSLTLVNNNAAESMPWLYQSVV
jgi:hypothetical protein